MSTFTCPCIRKSALAMSAMTFLLYERFVMSENNGNSLGPVTIRAAQATDLEPYRSLASELNALMAKHAPRYYRAPEGVLRSEDSFRAALDGEDRAIFVADCGGEAVGYIELEIRHDPLVPELLPCRWANIKETAVAEKFRRGGIGQQLMERASAWARGKSCAEIRLSVLDFNLSAQAFYVKKGFLMRNHIMALPLDLSS